MATRHTIRVGGGAVTPAVLGGDALVLIAGPCGLESPGIVDEVAAGVREVADRCGLPVIFKGSFDKANRTRAGAWRGPGLERGLQLLAEVRTRYRIPVTTDVHRVEQVGPVASVVDLVQVPAFLCRQTDLLRACGETDRAVNVKRGQFLAPDALGGIPEKVGRACVLTERGTTFGHGDLVFDPRMLVWMRSTGMPVCFDATHSVQQPGGRHTGGRREMVAPLARAAVAVGVDALFVEVHPDPSSAKSDAGSQVALADLPALLEAVLAVDRAVRSATD